MGFHLVIDNPDFDNLVYPPNKIIKTTLPAVNKSQVPTIFSLPFFTSSSEIGINSSFIGISFGFSVEN